MKTKLPSILPLVAILFLFASSARSALPDGHQDSGKEIYGPCAACHGEFGQGGKRGEYPRIAGQRPAYLEYSLRQFRSRERHNLPMYPYTQERELSDADIQAVSAYVAAIQLPTRPPEFKASDDALARLLAMEKVMIVPKLDGDLVNGSQLYKDECAYCHGFDGRGKTRFPMLVGQYTNYLQRQMEAYIKGERPHDTVVAEEEEEAKAMLAPPAKKVGVLNRLTEKDLQDILAHITHLQDN